jgi:hypothetical protein
VNDDRDESENTRRCSDFFAHETPNKEAEIAYKFLRGI